ncbi:iron transporter FeoA [Deltaproteobacteria bacterium Smac51]|nr:iron transporter FeoA [Deltaproteobacteria bacterium Smac51]
MTIISMRQMAANQSGTISRIKGGGELGVRIREMGIVPGAEIQIVGRAPLNDPVHIKLYGNNLTLRNNEADHIMVDVAEESGK